eukprot:m.188006 g.188006  ORF g.188006 m.188006 type:complete len:320 (+) comp10021_c1_seq29:48-1007(+)
MASSSTNGPVADTREDLVNAASQLLRERHYHRAFNKLRLAMTALPVDPVNPPPAELVNIEQLSHQLHGKSIKKLTREEAEDFVKSLRELDRMNSRAILRERRQRVCKPIVPHISAEYLMRRHQERGHILPRESAEMTQWRIQLEMFVAETIHLGKYGLPLFTELPVALPMGPAYMEAAASLKAMCPNENSTEGLLAQRLAAEHVDVTVHIAVTSLAGEDEAESSIPLTPVCPLPGTTASNMSPNCVPLATHVRRILNAVDASLRDMPTEVLIDTLHEEPPWLACMEHTRMHATHAYYSESGCVKAHPFLRPIMAKVESS